MFDVFLCHNSADKPMIRAIATQLQQHNISYWLDEEQLPPGCHWLDTQERDMSQLKSVAVFVGGNGIGKWQRLEISIFLQRFVEHDLRVIPVFLANVPPETDLMMFLKLFTWVDFRRTDPDPMQLLIQGITHDRSNANLVPIAEVKRIIAAEIKSKFQVPYLRNVYFTGRSQLLQDLHTELTGTGVAALSQVAAIAGLGGIGKTQTAVEYAYRHFPVDYDWVFWVKAETELSVVMDLAAIGQSLGLEGATLDEVAMQVRQWMETHDRWLLIFDNADRPELLKSILPRRPAGRILLTSRARRFVSVGIKAPLEIGKLSREESIDFLGDRTQQLELDSAESAAVEALAQELDGLPLALEQAGAYIHEMQMRFAVYLAHYRQQRVAMLERQMPETGDYPASVATTWLLNFEEAGRRSPLAVPILQVSAVLAADDIPEAVLQQSELVLGADELRLAEGLAALANFSLIQRDGGVYSIHRMVQEVVWQGLAAEMQHDWLERAIAALNAMFPNVTKIENWQRCGLLVPHIQAIAARLEVDPVHAAEVALLLNEAGYYLDDQGRYSEAEPLYARSLSIRERLLGADHLTVGTSLNNLALLYQSQGRYSQAEPLLKRSLSIHERQLGADHSDVGTSLNNLAGLYQSQGRYSQAQPLYERSLSILERQLGADHPDVALSLTNLAGLYKSQGRYSQAQPLYERSLSILERQLGADHPDVALSLTNLAGLYKSQGRYSEAEPLYERSLSIRERLLGANHPDVATSLNNLAGLYKSQGRYSQVEPLLKRSLSIRERQLGADHPDVATSLNNLAGLYKSQGRYSEAEPLLKRSLSIRERQLEADHPDVATSLNNLAELYQSQGRYSEAEPLYERSLSIREAQLGADHPDVATSLNNLAELYQSQGRYSEAEPLYEQSLSISEQQLGADHPDVATSLNNLAELYQSQGRYSEAEPLYERSLSISEQQLGADHPDIATSLNNLAGLYQSQGRYSQAEPLYERSLSIWEQQLGADHPHVALSLTNLAALYQSQGRYSQAQPLYERSLSILERQLGADHPDVALSLNNLAALYRTQGRYGEAEPLYRRSLSIREQQLGADHPHVAISLWNMAALCYEMNRLDEAKPLITKAVSIFEQRLSNQHPHTLNARQWWQAIHHPSS